MACLLKSEQPWPGALDCAQPLGCLSLWSVLGFKFRCCVDGKALYMCEMVGVAIITMITRDLLGLLGRCQPSQPPTPSQQKQCLLLSVGRRGSAEKAGKSSQHGQSSRGSLTPPGDFPPSVLAGSVPWGLCLLSSYTHALVHSFPLSSYSILLKL